MDLLIDGFRAIFTFLVQITSDYGFAIILFTIGINLILLPLNIKQRKNMQKQTILNEKVTQLKEKYKNNEKKLNEEMNALIQNEGTAMAGCLLSFLQIPIMYGIYQVVRSGLADQVTSVILPWIQSLVRRDPYFILPMLSIVVQSIPYFFPYMRQFKKIGLPKTKGQMIFIMVIMTGCIGVGLPSGVNLYYLVSSLFHTIEQFVSCVIRVKTNNNAVLE